jgi:PKD repeat protein
MAQLARFSSIKSLMLVIVFATTVTACNLTNSPEQLQLTEVPTNTPAGTGTGQSTGILPTTFPVTALVAPTTQSGQLPPTSISFPPTFAFFPTSTPTPISIVILSPIPGNVVSGNVQVLGAAIHPQFLQYQLEYGPDPNPGNLWFPATGIVQIPVLNGLLGIWNTTVVQDSSYQLRLRVILRDGSNLATLVNNIRIQNQAPTPIPSNTPNIPRPIAAFTQDRAVGQAPLTIKFTNQSSGNVTNYSWTFGDGGSSTEASPTYTFRNPGVYNVTLNIAGPGGTSNVSRQINVQSPTTPVAGFTQDKISGPSPLDVKFTNQSTGAISSYNWVFGDGATSTDANPSHQFTAVGTYNVILTVTGSGGSSSVTRKITVEDPVIPAPEAIFTPDKTSGDAPLTVQFLNQSTGQITSYLWDFGDQQTSTETNPTHTFSVDGAFTVTLTAIGPGGQKTAQSVITARKPVGAPVSAFTSDKTSGDVPLTIQFTNQSQGQIDSYEWAFGDGETSTEQSPAHTFGSPGNFTVKLTVTGSGGSNSTETVINVTQPIAVPDAIFVQDTNTGDAPLTVQFTNQSSGDNLAYTWDFGDNSGLNSDVSPLHTYNDPGTYTVVLTASNSSGSDTAQTTITVNTPQVVKPVANFTPNPASGDIPLTVTFDSSASTGDITAYRWDFGDNVGTSIEANPTYIFANEGAYTVSLIVSSNGLDSDPATATITVNATAPLPPPINQPVTFVSDRDGNNEIYTLGTDGSLTNLTNNNADDRSPVWSSDGSRIAFVSNRENNNNDIFVMNADGSNVINITNNGANDNSPTWSADGTQIAFVSDRDGNNEVYATNVADPSNPTNITNNPANDTNPVPAPNNTQFAFVSDRDGNDEIYIINVADPLNPINITNNSANDSNPAWSSNSNQIVFVSDRDNGNNDLFVINTDGSNPVNVTNNPADDNNPAWSSNSNQIVFVSDRDNGNTDLFVINTDGSNPVNVTNNPANDMKPSWKP